MTKRNQERVNSIQRSMHLLREKTAILNRNEMRVGDRIMASIMSNMLKHRDWLLEDMVLFAQMRDNNNKEAYRLAVAECLDTLTQIYTDIHDYVKAVCEDVFEIDNTCIVESITNLQNMMKNGASKQEIKDALLAGIKDPKLREQARIQMDNVKSANSVYEELDSQLSKVDSKDAQKEDPDDLLKRHTMF